MQPSMITYVNFSVSFHNTKIKTPAELNRLRQRIDEIMREYGHPAGRSNLEFDSDIEVEIDETAGQFEDGTN